MTDNFSDYDQIEYMKKLRNAGASQEQAEVQAQELYSTFKIVVKELKNMVKQELQAEKLRLANS